MDLGWVRDYGAFVAATIAAVAAILNNFFHGSRERDFRRAEWLRGLRHDRYASFLRAAYAYAEAIFWEYAEEDLEITGPKPADISLETPRRQFEGSLAEVKLLGPQKVAFAAQEVQFACWKYINQLQMDPFRYDQKDLNRYLDRFAERARESIEVEEPAMSLPRYADWLQEQKDSKE